MRIVPDSNAILADPWLKGTDWKTVIDARESLGHSICIPKVVAEEVLSHFERELLGLGEKRDIKRMGSLLGWESVEGVPKEISRGIIKYRAWFEDRIAKIASVVDYPDISLPAIARRSMAKRRPFDETGRGYVDTLIWEVVLTLASDGGPKVVLVSKDIGNFGDSSESLHEHLQSDLKERAVPTDRVIYFTKLEDFVNSHIRPALAQVKEVRSAIEQGKFPIPPLDFWLMENSRSVLGKRSWDPGKLGLRKEFRDPFFGHIDDVYSIKVIDARQLPPQGLLIECEAHVAGDFFFHVLNSDFDTLGPSQIPNYGVLDKSDAEKESFISFIHLEAVFHLSVVVDQQTGAILSAEVRDVRLK
jgi:hypothetical protein